MSIRVSRGSRLCSLCATPSQQPNLSAIDSAFQLQEYLTLLIKTNVHDVQTIVRLPVAVSDTENPKEKEKEELSVDEGCWIYEQLRRLAQDLTHPLITTLQAECTRQTCPEMKAGEWLYLCVAHGNGATMECCAIDYILHTLDSATALLNNPKLFPSRISIPQASYRHFSLLARRLSRIFAHAYFHHREAFEQSEAETSLYERFLVLTQTYSLVSSEFLVIPPRQLQDSSPPRSNPPSLPETSQPSANGTVSQDLSIPNPRVPTAGSSPLGRKRTGTMLFSGDFVLGPEFDVDAAAEFEGQYEDMLSGDNSQDISALRDSPPLDSSVLMASLPLSTSVTDFDKQDLTLESALGIADEDAAFETVELMSVDESALPLTIPPDEPLPVDMLPSIPADSPPVSPAPSHPVLLSSSTAETDYEVSQPEKLEPPEAVAPDASNPEHVPPEDNALGIPVTPPDDSELVDSSPPPLEADKISPADPATVETPQSQAPPTEDPVEASLENDHHAEVADTVPQS